MLGLPSCKQVSEQSSHVLDESLPFFQRLAFKFHLMLCERCRVYVKQMQLTKASIGYWINGRIIPDDVKQKIMQQYQSDNEHQCNKQH